MDFKHFSTTSVGQVRAANEDNYGDRMTANGYVFVVCDGMGGHVGGATASRIAVDSVLDFFENPVQNIYVGINDAFQFANANVLMAAQQDPSLQGMGTTGTILVINQEGCFIGHVGDSRIYLKSDGRLNRLTKDHSFVQTLVDQGIISDDQAEDHPKKNQILEALGIKQQVNPTICSAPIQPKVGDCFLLCSDGLNGMIKDSIIEELVDPSNLEFSGKSLIDAANHAGGKDNITATLVTITESPFSSSVFVHFNPVKKSIAPTTVIDPMIGSEYKRGNKKLYLLIAGASLLLITVLLWFFVFNEPKDSTVKTEIPKSKVESSPKAKKVGPTDSPVNSKTERESSRNTQRNDTQEREKKEERDEELPKEEVNENKTTVGPTSHKVKSGENLSKIAARFSVSEEAIIKANTGEGSKLSVEDQEKLKNKVLDIGWILIIPAPEEI